MYCGNLLQFPHFWYTASRKIWQSFCMIIFVCHEMFYFVYQDMFLLADAMHNFAEKTVKKLT
jgi:hypothetical protein